jgi:hypothetical protein
MMAACPRGGKGMTEPGPNQEHEEEMTQEEAIALHRAKRRSCIFKLILIWFSIGAVIILVMIYTRSKVNRDPEQIQSALDQIMTIDLPEAFYPYSMNDFLGVKLFVFNHSGHLREDGRTTSVLAINIDNRWEDQSVAEARAGFVEGLPDQLNKREFRVKEQRVEVVEDNGERIEIDVFTGIQLLGDDYVDGVACFRFLMGPDGPIQVHTLGLKRNFPAKDQAAILASVRVKAPKEDP